MGRHNCQRGSTQTHGAADISATQANRLQIAKHSYGHSLPAGANKMLRLQHCAVTELALQSLSALCMTEHNIAKWIDQHAFIAARLEYSNQKVARKVHANQLHIEASPKFQIDNREADRDTFATREHMIEIAVARVVVVAIATVET